MFNCRQSFIKIKTVGIDLVVDGISCKMCKLNSLPRQLGCGIILNIIAHNMYR